MKDDFRFGECLIQPQLNRIKTPHDSIRVEPKVMELLVYLAKHREEVLPKERVIQTVWPDSYVADDVLTSAVWKLRRTLGDDPKDPRYIETIPKAGYRLIAPVSYGEDELGFRSKELERSRRSDTKASPSEPGGSSEESSSGRKRRQARVAASLLTAAIALILAIWYWPVTEKSLSKTQGRKPSVAVLYFQNLSQDRDGDIWAAGMTEAVITDLAKLGRLAVKSRLQVLPFKDQTPDLETIRNELGVDVFVDTSLQKIGSELRIHTKLIDADSGDHLWAETYERSIREIFQVQDEISQAIATALGVELAGVQRSVLMARPTQNSAAFEYASEGIYHLDREEYDKALIAFDSALKLDPGYALAHYYKGRTYQTMEAYELAIESYNQALPRADQFSRKLWEWKSPHPGTRWSYSKRHQIAIAASTDFEKRSIQLTALDLTRKQVVWKQSPPGADVRLLTPDPELQSEPYDATLLVETRPVPAPVRGGVGDPREATVHAYDIMRGDLLFRKTFRPAVHTPRPLRIANSPGARRKTPILIHLASRWGGEIHCLNPRTGRERWVFQWDGGLERPQPTAEGGFSLSRYSWIVVDESGTDALFLPFYNYRGNQKVRRYVLLDLDKGTIIWEMDLPEPQQSVVHQDRIIAIHPDNGLVSCTRISDRTQIWSYQAQAEITDWVGLAANNLLILQLAGGKLVGIDTSDRLFDFGRRQWTVDLGDASYKFWSDQGHLGSSDYSITRANLVKAQTLFAVSEEGNIHSLDLMTGELMGIVESELDEPWLYNLEGTVLARASTHLMRPDPSYGDIQWQVRRSITPVEVAQNRVLSANPGLVSALDLEDGGLLWSYRPQGRVSSRYWVSGGSHLFSVTAEERFVPLDDGLIEISIQENPDERIVSSKEVHSRLSECALSLGDYETAEALLLQIVDMDPGHAPAYWMLADIYQETDRRGEALKRVIDYQAVSRPGSPESARALERLREEGLLWRSDIDRVFTPVFSDGERLISGWKNEVGGTFSRTKFDIFSLHKESGEVVWSRKLNYFKTCGLDERYLFSIHDTGGERNLLKRKKVLSAIDKSTGESGWVVQLDCEGDLLPIPGIHENRVFSTCDYTGVNQDQRRVLAFDTSSGQLVWERESKGRLGTLYSGHLVLVASAGVELLSAETGEHEWWFPTSDRKIASNSVFLEKNGEPDGRLVFMTEDNYFHCLDLNKRQELWSAPSPLSKRLNPRSAVGDTLIAVGPTGFTALRYDPRKEGISIVWRTPMDLGQKQLFGMLDHDQAFYFPSREGSLLQLDKATGAIQREYPLLLARKKLCDRKWAALCRWRRLCLCLGPRSASQHPGERIRAHPLMHVR